MFIHIIFIIHRDAYVIRKARKKCMPERHVQSTCRTLSHAVPAETGAFSFVAVLDSATAWGIGGTGGTGRDVGALREGRSVVFRSFMLWQVRMITFVQRERFSPPGSPYLSKPLFQPTPLSCVIFVGFGYAAPLTIRTDRALL